MSVWAINKAKAEKRRDTRSGDAVPINKKVNQPSSSNENERRSWFDILVWG